MLSLCIIKKMASILLLYGSTGGNTEITLEKVAEVLREHGHEPTLQRAECFEPQELTQFEVCVLGSPTYGHGVLQQHMDDFIRKLPKNGGNEKGKSHEAIFLGKRCAVVGLGDGKYDPYYLIESATILEDLVKAQGGTLLLPALRINKSPLPQLDGAIAKWAEELAKLI